MNNIPGGKELIDSQALLEKAGLGEKMKVADFGCGRKGHFSLQASSMVGQEGIVYAIDVLKSALESLKRQAQMFGLDNIKTIWADLEIPKASQIPSSKIDLVMMNNLLFQVKNQSLVLEEAKRILKPEGKLLITDWEKKAAPFGPEVKARVDKEEVRAMVENLGFKMEKEWQAGPYHWAMLFKKEAGDNF